MELLKKLGIPRGRLQQSIGCNLTGQTDSDAKVGAAGSDEEHDRFLIEEGLDLLAAFRSIKDPKRRDRLKRLVIRCAEVDGAKVDRNAVVVPFR